MEYACDKKYINLEEVERSIERLQSLLMTIDEYFIHSEEYAYQNAIFLAYSYTRYQNLMSISLDLVRELLGEVSIVQQNIEDGVYH